MRGPLATLIVGVSLVSSLAAQQDAPPNGPVPVDPKWHALTHATLVAEPGWTIRDATIVVRDGVIRSIEVGGEVPDGARVWDCSERTVYAAFVDAYVGVDAPRPDAGVAGAHWNEMVHPQRSALDGNGLDNTTAKSLRAAGFGAAAASPTGGILRGRAALVTLEHVDTDAKRDVVVDDAYSVAALERARSWGNYPGSQMGAIALLRQTFFDAEHDGLVRGAAMPTTPAPASAALAALRDRDALFVVDASDELEAIRLARVMEEVGRRAIVLGSGYEFRRIGAIAANGLPVIVPLAFPAAPDVATIEERERVSLRELQTWEQAPTNAARLARAGVPIALTTHRLDDRGSFLKQLRKAVAHGLDRDAALAALTTTPAEWLGAADRIGRVAPGMLANLLVVEGDVFADDAEIRSVWVRGERHAVTRAPEMQLEGTWRAAMKVGDLTVDELVFKSSKSLQVRAGERGVGASRVAASGRQLQFVFDAAEIGGDGVVAASAVFDGLRLLGVGLGADGESFAWTARRVALADASESEDEKPEAKKRTSEPAIADATTTLALPFGAFGRPAIPAQQDVRVVNATIWTGGPLGILEDGVLVTRGGRVVWVGPAADAPAPAASDVVVDAGGGHVTPGLIDCHSHTGISRGINESSQAVTAEVRIGDVVNPDDIGWYRELAGGLTAVNQLHGSANPIGGQNNIVKLRWGVADPEAMKLRGAKPGIKFALGENVKRGNSGNDQTDRYPQTRMGVEAIIRDRFLAARAYRDRLERATSPADRPARDLELEALAEILAGERLIHCHSYRQDEILMLCRVAEEFGFTIGTFQHGLECYKVAESVKRSSLGASIFTDWWAYKFEVFDAIPENGPILHEVGVNVSFNSDSNELARRMNTEAAKAVKYGAVDPHAALQFVTLNPARQLAVDDRIGSLEVGKDADFVIWSGDPLSTFTRCLSTWIDGRRYWDADEDLELRAKANADRQRLIQLVLSSGDSAKKGSRARDAASDDSLDNTQGECDCFLHWRTR